MSIILNSMIYNILVKKRNYHSDKRIFMQLLRIVFVLLVGLEVSQAEFELGITQARLVNIRTNLNLSSNSK